MKRCISTLAFLLIVICVSAGIAAAQSTGFTYQGKLNDGANPANANYDFEFRLYDAAAAGGQIGSIATRTNVAVIGGTFSVTLDFGTGAFPGADRWIEIGIRPAGSGGGFQQLLPRTKLAWSPYAIQSLNAATAANATNAINATNATNAATAANALNLGGEPASNYVLTGDIRLSDPRAPTAGSGSYIQNQNLVTQPVSNFHISGNGRVAGTLTGNIVDATTQLNINSVRAFTMNGLFSSPVFQLAPSNTFAGAGAGINTTPNPETPFSQGKENSFFGARAGLDNVLGSGNSFFGSTAGESNTNGLYNSFFGLRAGGSNTGGDNNSFFGTLAGSGNTGGEGNTFVGRNAGSANTNGDNNTALGYLSSVSEDLQYATAIGSSAQATLSNSIYLGRPAGEDTVRVPGNLVTTGTTTLNGNLVQASGGLAVCNSPVRLASLSTGGETTLCRRVSDQIISTCGSSLRYKININRFGLGLNLIKQLKPITFDWKDGGMHDLGLGAEDVAAIEPLLVTYNAKGEVEGVKYDRIGVVLVNAVKEQQTQIEKLSEQNRKQQLIIESLVRSVCKQKSDDAMCKELK